MKKLLILFAVASLVMGTGGIASAYLINTGPGPTSSPTSGGWVLSNLQFLAGEFTLTQIATITSIEGWMACSIGGQLIAAIYSGGGSVPNGVIDSTSFSINRDSSYPQFTWHGAMGLNWVLAPGTYWVSFEGPASGSADASMLYPSASPLGKEAYWNGTRWISSIADIGVRIDGSQVPIPASFLLLGSGLLGLVGWRRLRKG